jgi:hypothetical protein
LNDHEFILEFADIKLLNFLKKEEKPQQTIISSVGPGEEEKKNEEPQIEPISKIL